MQIISKQRESNSRTQFELKTQFKVESDPGALPSLPWNSQPSNVAPEHKQACTQSTRGSPGYSPSVAALAFNTACACFMATVAAQCTCSEAQLQRPWTWFGKKERRSPMVVVAM